jgi:ubiquinone/menaquinone biosynthesis C-methylase UbiE
MRANSHETALRAFFSHGRAGARRRWASGTHERRVERFYSHGAARYGDYHGGFLNFGLWGGDVRSYEEAARRLVGHLLQWGRCDHESSILDVGCGMGAQDLVVWQSCHPRLLVGMDVTWQHVEAARERARRERLPPSVRFEHGTATSLPFPDAHFTHVLSVEGGVHFDTRERFLREAYRALRQGGVLVLADYTLVAPPRTLLDHALVRALMVGWCVPKENCDTAASLRAKLRQSGFVAIEIESVGERTYPYYFREQSRGANLLKLAKIRGLLPTLGGLLIDWVAYRAWKGGVIDYVLVRADKPGGAPT